MKRIVILGGGTAGTIMANRLRKVYRRDMDAGRVAVTVVDQDEQRPPAGRSSSHDRRSAP